MSSSSYYRTPEMFGKGQFRNLGKGLASVGRVESTIGSIISTILGVIFILGGISIMIWGAVGPKIDCDPTDNTKICDEEDKKPMPHGMRIGLIVGGIFLALFGGLVIWLSSVTKKLVRKNPDLAAVFGGVGVARGIRDIF